MWHDVSGVRGSHASSEGNATTPLWYEIVRHMEPDQIPKRMVCAMSAVITSAGTKVQEVVELCED